MIVDKNVIIGAGVRLGYGDDLNTPNGKAAAAKGVPAPGNHNPGFAPTPEPTIKAGILAMTLSVMNLLPVEGS